jgi:hypothetical protein
MILDFIITINWCKLGLSKTNLTFALKVGPFALIIIYMKIIENKWSINDIWWFKNLEILNLTFSLSNNLLLLDSSVDRRTHRINRNLGNQSVGD